MQVFISHAAADQQLAAELTSELRRAGIHVWSDDSLLPGDNWAMEVGKALESSEVMVVLLTQNANESTTIKQDVQYALTSGSYHGRVVPVLVGFATFQAGKDVPWVLLRMGPIHVQGNPPDFRPISKRIQEIFEAECHAAV